MSLCPIYSRIKILEFYYYYEFRKTIAAQIEISFLNHFSNVVSFLFRAKNRQNDPLSVSSDFLRKTNYDTVKLGGALLPIEFSSADTKRIIIIKKTKPRYCKTDAFRSESNKYSGRSPSVYSTLREHR